MKKLRIFIIIELILICIVAVILVITKNKASDQNNSNEVNNIKENIVGNTTNENIINENTSTEDYPNREKIDIESQDVKVVENRTDFFTVQSIVNKYLNILASNNTNNLKNLLDKEYLENNNIDDIEKNMANQVFKADRIYYRVDNNISTYFAYGTVEEEVMDEKMPETEFNITVIIDYNNNAFSIIPKEILNINTYKYEGDNINKNENNTYDNILVTDENMASIYLSDYIQNAIYDIEKAYNSLDEEYRIQRFKNIDSYKNYLNNMQDVLFLTSLDKYGIVESDGYINYIVIDNYGHFYMFQEISPMQYSVILDTYTKDIPGFLEKYSEGDIKEKVKLNILRFFEAIYAKDYEYAYSKLEDEFKETYFSTIETFEEYIKNTFEDKEKIVMDNFSDLGEMYTYNVELKSEGNRMEKEFTVNLLEGTDFTISFEV